MSSAATMTLSADQEAAVETLTDWLTNRPTSQYATLAGLAGTGKTTVMSHVRDRWSDLGKRCLFAAPMGRAASVLRSKGVPANTLFSMLYNFGGTYLDHEGKEQVRSRDKPWSHDCDVLIVDESSTIEGKNFDDLMRYGVRCLFVGDHGQLAPVGRDPGLMRKPLVKLERIHRQAEGSQILKAAYWARRDQSIPYGEGGDVAVRPVANLAAAVSQAIREGADRMIAGRNKSRFEINRLFRLRGGYREDIPPQPGEPVLCRLNDAERDVYNGEIYYVHSIKRSNSRCHVLRLSNEAGVEIPGNFRCYRYGFEAPAEMLRMDLLPSESLFQFGYCLTAHSAQGSEWPRVAVLDEPIGEVPRWRYTAFTRASERLAVLRLDTRRR